MGDADRTVSAAARKFTLRVEGALPVSVLGGQVLVGSAAIGPQLFVLAGVACAVERFGIERRTGGDHAAGDQRVEPLAHQLVHHPSGRAGIDEVLGDQRHTSARAPGSASSAIPPSVTQSTCRDRAAAAAACRSAARTVSETPLVCSSRCAAESSSSSSSISRFVTPTPPI